MRENKTPEITQYDLIVEKNSKFFHLFNFLHKEYGNDLDKLLKCLSSGFLLGLLIKYTKNKKLRETFQLLQKLIPATLFTTDFILRIKHYYKSLKTSDISPYIKKLSEISKILEIPENSIFFANVPDRNFYFSTDIIMWLYNRPNVKKFKIKKYFNMILNEEIENINTILNMSEKKIESINLGLLIELNNNKIFWNVSLLQLRDSFISKESLFYSENMSDELILELRKNILSEYVSSLNIKENIILFNYWNIITKPRRKVQEKINQFNVEELIIEIREILSRKRKRAFAFVGKQGVGKSVILRRIEEKITDFTIFHITPEDFDNADTIKDRFEVIKTLQPAIVIIEDLDSCGLKEKNKTTGEFLNCIDEVNRDLNIILLVSINDTSLIHYTIINRPGRFDRIFEIKSPQSKKEVFEIIQSKINVIKSNYCTDNPLFLKEMDTSYNLLDKILENCVTYDFTQAEIANAIVEQALIDINIKINTDSLKGWAALSLSDMIPFLEKAIIKHLKTREALENCNFHNENSDLKKHLKFNPNPDLKKNKDLLEKQSYRSESLLTEEVPKEYYGPLLTEEVSKNYGPLSSPEKKDSRLLYQDKKTPSAF